MNKPKLLPPLSQNDLIKTYCVVLQVAIAADSDLLRFIDEEKTENELRGDCVIRLLQQRMELSKQGY
jgi:hypothetical protein